MDPIKELEESKEEDLKDDVLSSGKEIQELIKTIPISDENKSIIENLNTKFSEFLDKISTLSLARQGRFTMMEQMNNTTEQKIDVINTKIDIIIKMMRHNKEGESNADEYYDKVYKNGNKYIGNLVNDRKEGKGKMYYADKSVYNGEWKNDKRNGKGVLEMSNGDKYEGEFFNDLMEGKGEYYFKNGRKYVGDFRNNKMEGKGRYRFPTGNEYNGDFKNGLFNGNAVFTYANGDRFEGQYQNGKKNGKGVYYYRSGEVFTGEWLKDERHGEGVLVSKGKEQKLFFDKGKSIEPK